MDCRKLAERMGYVVYKGSGRPGAPDKILIRDSFAFVVEVKKPKGIQSDAQKREQKYCKSRGVDYHIVRSVKQFADILLSYEKR